MFEPTDAAYKAMGREESQVNYWDDESNNFYEALNLAFSDDLEKCQSDIVKETKAIFYTNVANGSELLTVVQVPLLGGRVWQVGKFAVLPGHCSQYGTGLFKFRGLLRVENLQRSDSFESIILQFVLDTGFGIQ